MLHKNKLIHNIIFQVIHNIQVIKLYFKIHTYTQKQTHIQHMFKG